MISNGWAFCPRLTRFIPVQLQIEEVSRKLRSGDLGIPPNPEDRCSVTDLYLIVWPPTAEDSSSRATATAVWHRSQKKTERKQSFNFLIIVTLNVEEWVSILDCDKRKREEIFMLRVKAVVPDKKITEFCFYPSQENIICDLKHSLNSS